MKVVVAILHGIGDQSPDWAEPIIEQLRRRVLEEAAVIPSQDPPEQVDEILEIVPVWWAGVMQERQRCLHEVLAAGSKPMVLQGAWWRKLLARARHLGRQVEYRFVAESLADVIGYLDPQMRSAVHETVERALAKVPVDADAPGKMPLTFVGHSLGSVIASNVVWDGRRAAGASGGFHPRFRFDNFFTVGSPLALFSLKYGGPEAFTQPAPLEHLHGRWVNIYDDDDPVGMPLKALNTAYERAVLKDVLVDAGDYLLAHRGYFAEPRTITIISRKLALDWLALNRRLSDEQIRAYYEAYDESLTV